MLAKALDHFIDVALHLFEVDVQSISILRTVGLEVKDDSNDVPVQRLLIKHAFNSIHGGLIRFLPKKRNLPLLVPRWKPYLDA